MKDTKEKTIKGVAWNALSKISQTVVNFVITLVLVRFLSPADFGEIGMVIVFSGFALVLVDFGLTSAIIQQKKVSQEQLSSVFWLSCFLSGLIALIFILLSPVIASFYSNPRLQILALAISLSFIIYALGATHRSLLIKELRFKAIFKVNLTAILSSGILAIILAIQNYEVWSLIVQLLCNSFISTLLLWITVKWRPSFIFNFFVIKRLVNFGLNLTGNGILNYWARNFDNLLVGKVLGESALGIYSKAYSLLIFPLSNITYVVNQVLFPVFSKIQEDHKQIATIYIKAVSSIAFITFPVMLGLFVVSDHFVFTFFGFEWMEMIPLIRIFAFLGMIQSILGTTGSLFLSQNRTDLVFKFSLATKGFLFIALLLCVNNGLIAIAYCLVAFTVITGYIQIYLATRLIKLELTALFKNLLPIMAITLATGFIVYLIDSQLRLAFEHLLCLLMDLFSGALIYMAFMFLFRVQLLNDFQKLIKEQFLKLKDSDSI